LSKAQLDVLLEEERLVRRDQHRLRLVDAGDANERSDLRPGAFDDRPPRLAELA
jgi:hypothetical protein